MHPRGFEEAMRVASLERFALLIHDDDRTRRLGKLQDIVAHANHKRRQGCHISRTKELRLLVSSGAQVNAFLSQLRRSLIPLQLPTPKATKVTVYFAIIVLEDARVYAERTADGVFLGDEGTFGLLTDSYGPFFSTTSLSHICFSAQGTWSTSRITP